MTLFLFANEFGPSIKKILSIITHKMTNQDSQFHSTILHNYHASFKQLSFTPV